VDRVLWHEGRVPNEVLIPRDAVLEGVEGRWKEASRLSCTRTVGVSGQRFGSTSSYVGVG
jgi:hypothetical protein